MGNIRCPLSFFSLHQLTDLYLCDCDLEHQPPSTVFGSLTTLNLYEIGTSEKALLRLLSSCPLLKRLTIMCDGGTIDDSGDSTIADLIKCIPGIEYLSVLFFIFLISAEDDMSNESYVKIHSFQYEDYSDFILEHLNELEILHFSDALNELDFVKLILAKSPVLKKARILMWDEIDKDENLRILNILLSSPCASPVVKISVR
ncbi:putative FBD domain, leucine-rich repeat domain superfamily [Helianthus debilis subsp. tardiflorus]